MKTPRQLLSTDRIAKNGIKLVCFDMDGTLIKGTSANLHFAMLLGVEDEVIRMEQLFQSGELKSEQFMVLISEVMKDLTLDFIKSHFYTLPLIAGINETIAELKKHDIIPIIATTSNIMFAECFKEEFGFIRVYGTKHLISDSGHIGIGTEVCSSTHKIQYVESFSSQHGIEIEAVAAVGDSISDIPIFERVGLSIALNCDESLIGKADCYLNTENLRDILDYLIRRNYDRKKNFA